MTTTTANKALADAPKVRSALPSVSRKFDLDGRVSRFFANRPGGRFSDELPVDEPITHGLHMRVVRGDGTRRQDVVGLYGTVQEKVVRKDGAVYTFLLENGELVNSHEIWWRRIPDHEFSARGPNLWTGRVGPTSPTGDHS